MAAFNNKNDNLVNTLTARYMNTTALNLGNIGAIDFLRGYFTSLALQLDKEFRTNRNVKFIGELNMRHMQPLQGLKFGDLKEFAVRDVFFKLLKDLCNAYDLYIHYDEIGGSLYYCITSDRCVIEDFISRLSNC